jgi:hypothetical protein
VSLSRLWAFLAVALPILAALIAALPSVDLTYHLRAGAEILDTGAIPSADTWTFTAAGQPWTDQQWGSQVILAAVYRIGGWTGLVLLRAVLVGAIFGSLYLVGRRRGLDVRRAAWLTIAAFIVAAPALALRPQLLGMALFALVLLLIVDRRAHPGRLWAVPIIVLAWANLHGSFFLGPLVLGLAWLEDLHDGVARPHRTLAVAVVAGLAACLTPFGPSVWAYAVGLSANPEVTRRITEWQRTSVADLAGGGALFYASALVTALLIARRGRATPWPTLLWLGIFFVIGAYAVRGIAWWAPAAVAAIAGTVLVSPVPQRPERDGTRTLRRLNLVVAGAIGIACVVVLPPWRGMDPGTNAPRGVVTEAPSGITAVLRGRAHDGDRLLNPQRWGSWFEFALPQVPVAIDSRIELFPVEVWDAYDRIWSGAPGWEAQLAVWAPTMAVVDTGNPDLVNRLQASGWQSVHSDTDGWVLVAP